MKHLNMTRVFAPLLALMVGLSACASSGMGSGTVDDATAFIRVQNELPARYMTISLENSDDNVVPLGNVSQGESESFRLQVDEMFGEYQLVATAPSVRGSPDVVISESFIVEGGMTLNWFLEENENRLEIN